MSIKVELEQYKAWLVSLRERHQVLLGERDVLKHQRDELVEAAEAMVRTFADRGNDYWLKDLQECERQVRAVLAKVRQP